MASIKALKTGSGKSDNRKVKALLHFSGNRVNQDFGHR